MAWGCMQPAFLEYLLCHLKMHFWLQNARLHRKVITYKRLNSFEQRRAMGTNITRMLIHKICIITILEPWYYKRPQTASNSNNSFHILFINVSSSPSTFDQFYPSAMWRGRYWQLICPNGSWASIYLSQIFLSALQLFATFGQFIFQLKRFSPFWRVVKSAATKQQNRKLCNPQLEPNI